MLPIVIVAREDSVGLWIGDAASASGKFNCRPFNVRVANLIVAQGGELAVENPPCDGAMLLVVGFKDA